MRFPVLEASSMLKGWTGLPWIELRDNQRLKGKHDEKPKQEIVEMHTVELFISFDRVNIFSRRIRLVACASSILKNSKINRNF